MTPSRLIARFLQGADLKVAIEHPFLKAAGTYELDKDKLSEWLTQDRIYALCGYPKFIASLISATPLSSTSSQRASQSLLGLFSFALSNIDREVGFFDSLGPKYGLDLEFPPPESKSFGKLQGSLVKPTTKAYVDLLIATGAEAGINGGLEEALVLLWGMEKVKLPLAGEKLACFLRSESHESLLFLSDSDLPHGLDSCQIPDSVFLRRHRLTNCQSFERAHQQLDDGRVRRICRKNREGS